MSLGSILREAREKKGLSVAQVAEQTRMIHQMVEELENDDFHRIAAAIYGRGFIRLYAECVDLDSEPLVKEFNEVYSGFRRPSINTRQVRTEPVEMPPKKASEQVTPAEPVSRPVIKERVVETAPETKPVSAPEVKPEILVKPEPVPVAEPKSESIPEAKSEPTPEPKSEPIAEPVPVPIPEEKFKPVPEAEPAHVAAVIPEEKPAPVVEPAPAVKAVPVMEVVQEEKSKPAVESAPSVTEPGCIVPEKQKPIVSPEPIVKPVAEKNPEPVEDVLAASEPDAELEKEPVSAEDEKVPDDTEKNAGDEQYGELFNRTVVTPDSVIHEEKTPRNAETPRHAPLPVFTQAPSWDDNGSVRSDSLKDRIVEFYRKAPYTIAGICLCFVAIIMLLIAIASSSGKNDSQDPTSPAEYVVEDEISGDLPTRTDPAPVSSGTGETVYSRHILPPPDSYVE